MMVIPFFGGMSPSCFPVIFPSTPSLPAPFRAEETVLYDGSFRCTVPDVFRFPEVSFPQDGVSHEIVLP